MILIPSAGVIYVQLVLNQFVVMENRRFEERKEPEIAYSRSVKAGKRIYYLDVKKAKNDDLYLCITESKKKQGPADEVPQFEKHKIFLYKEDFAHFNEGLQDVMRFVQESLGTIEERQEWHPESQEEAQGEPVEAKEEEAQEPKKRGFFGRFMGN